MLDLGTFLCVNPCLSQLYLQALKSTDMVLEDLQSQCVKKVLLTLDNGLFAINPTTLGIDACTGTTHTADGEICKSLYSTADGEDGNCSSPVINGEVSKGSSLVGRGDTSEVDCEPCADVGSRTTLADFDSCRYNTM